MVKASTRKFSRRAVKSVGSQAPRLKFFCPIGWYGGIIAKQTGDYVAHILMELGRLGLDISDIERTDRPPNRETVLSDLIEWLSDFPGEAFARLVNWQTLDFAQLQLRLKENLHAKPRIELSAHITKMNNLTVLWHPEGWRNTEFDFNRADRDHSNLITHRKWRQPPDFQWFVGDEEPTFDSRPSNELLFLRGVGNLRPEFRDYGPYAKYNKDVVDSILICAVRAAYESLIKQLQYCFEVNVLNNFDFTMQKESEEVEPAPFGHSIHRVIGWTLEDAVELRARQERDRAIEEEKCDRATLANVESTYGFTMATFIAALSEASSKKASGPAPSSNYINQRAAKKLRNTGFAIDAGDVRRIRGLVERYTPDILPERLWPSPRSKSSPDNILSFPDSE
ncbi:MAG: hypothetical protein HC850_13635 [Rhodomicrobium sp.]|nr:hypothetical protein [Rhodomicrobium sp.]